ncbi:hypothetical protein D3C84_1005300 [compost metagenome]
MWEVEGTLKPGERHIYGKRHMYFDEDTWQAAAIDHYDGRGQLWRVAEGMAINDYEQGAASYVSQSLYDLIAGRYLVMGLSNEFKQGTEFGIQPNASAFTPAALRNAGIR